MGHRHRKQLSCTYSFLCLMWFVCDQLEKPGNPWHSLGKRISLNSSRASNDYVCKLQLMSAGCGVVPWCGKLISVPKWNWKKASWARVTGLATPLVISKGLETPAGTRVRVGRVGVRVWNVWPHINPYPWVRVRVYPHCYWRVSPVMFAPSQTCYQQTNKAFPSQWQPSSWPPLLHHHHHPPPPLHTRMMMIVWQCHVTGPICMQFRTTYGEDDLAHQRMCHVVIPVHNSQGKQLDTPPPVFTWEVGAIAIGNMATNSGWRMTNYGQPGEPSHCPPPLIFSHEKQVPHQLTMEQQCGMTMTHNGNDVTTTWYSHHRPQWWCQKLSDLANAIAMSIDMCITFVRYRCCPWPLDVPVVGFQPMKPHVHPYPYLQITLTHVEGVGFWRVQV